MTDPLPYHPTTRSLNWLRLKRLIGLTPSTPISEQEGQLRYSRDGDVDGSLRVAQYRAGGSYEWASAVLATIDSPRNGSVLAYDGTGWRDRVVLTYPLGTYFVHNCGAGATTQATRMYFNTATAVNRSTNEQRMDRAGEVVGMVMTSDVSVTAGTITARVRINGVGAAFNGGACVLNTTYPNSNSSHTYPGNGVAFAAGQTVGVEVEASVGMTPGNVDLDIIPIVLVYPYD